MDEETMRERELSEEQLGEISGGCGACRPDRAAITRAKGRMAEYRAGLQRAHVNFDITLLKICGLSC